MIKAEDFYIPDGHEPNMAPVDKLYREATKELLVPFPSVRFRNFPSFNLLTGGFRPYEFSILCGGTGVGKTTLIANWSLDLMGQDIPHFVASVETGHTDFIKRTMSAKSGEDWNSGDPVNASDLKNFNDQHQQTFLNRSCILSLYDNRFSVEVLMADIASSVKIHGVKIAFIDNLNFFLEITSAANAIVEMDRVIHELIIFCKRVNVHVVMVMHPKKTETGRVENEFDIKGSSTAVQEAHNIFLFNKPHAHLIKEGTAKPIDREIKICKMRRKGRYVGMRLLFVSKNGTKYDEGVIV